MIGGCECDVSVTMTFSLEVSDECRAFC